MTMLYKVAEGAVKDTHYGLALARVVPLPPGLVERATFVAQKLERHIQQRKKTSTAVIKERRRKLILNLKEHLVQAHSGVMEGEVLTAWLKELQKEFVKRMTAIDEEVRRAEQGIDSEEEDEDKGGDEDLMEQSVRSDADVDMDERPETRSTHTSQPSVISIDSRMTSTESTSTMRAVSENEL
jgi:DNA mismatch repair protein MSH4